MTIEIRPAARVQSADLPARSPHPGRARIKGRGPRHLSVDKWNPSGIDDLMDVEGEPRDLFEHREVERYLAAHWAAGEM
jgi:hypothetical protein